MVLWYVTVNNVTDLVKEMEKERDSELDKKNREKMQDLLWKNGITSWTMKWEKE